ncbi:MAG TPA: LysR family transcriptional regulator [Vicinamibacterales bacterium]|nr:LysR family transcriptional regulator [Vicinamibacterales bacterium]
MLNLDRLRALHAVSAHGSIIAAAETLNVTTSAVSQQLAKLEQETGQQLLERHGRGVRLTDAAATLVLRTHRVLSLLEEAEAELESSDTAVAGQIVIAAFATAARGLAPQAIRGLRKHYPQLAITFHEQEPHESIPRLVRRDVDLIIINDWQNAPIALPEGLTKAPLFDDVADIALPPGHPLSRAKTLRLTDLAGEEWIAWPSGSICHDFLMHTLRKQGSEPKIAHTAGEYQTQLALVAAGLGCCVLPRLGRGTVPKGVTVVPSGPALRRHVYAAWRTHSTRRAAIQAAVEQFQIVGRELAKSGA